MVLLENNLHEPDSTQYYYGECDSLLANCCSKTRLLSPFKFRAMNRQRRQMAFDMLRQMKSQQHKEIFSTRSKRRKNKKRFYRALCCTGKMRNLFFQIQKSFFYKSIIPFVFFSSIELHITESQSSVYSPTMATVKYKPRIPCTGLTNELYFSSHKPDGDNEKTPPVLMRNKRRSPHLNIVPIDDTPPTTSNNRRPISSPVRSTTYILQQHHRVINNQNNITNKKPFSPVHQQNQSSSVTSTTFNNKTRQTQQQRTFSNHERLPSTVDSPSTSNQQFISRTQIALTPRRTSPIVKSTPTKTTTYISRSPRVSNREREKVRQRESERRKSKPALT
jgi:hypothetical protein